MIQLVQCSNGTVLDLHHRGCGSITHPGPVASYLEQVANTVCSDQRSLIPLSGWQMSSNPHGHTT